MGFDIGLGIFVLIAAVRGWSRGFVLQAIRLASLGGSIFAAGPIRDLARPHVAPYLATIRPDLLDRMLWWTAAVLSYGATVGLATLVVRMTRQRGLDTEAESNRLDQLAGFVLGAGKGAIVASFLVWGFERQALPYLGRVAWVAEQARTSRAIELDTRYRPAERIWTAPPVQMVVAQIRRMGIDAPESAGDEPAVRPSPTPRDATAQNPGRAPRLDLPDAAPAVPPGTADEIAREVDAVIQGLEAARPAADPR